MYELIGAIVGGLLGLLIPILLMLIYVAFGDAQSAAGAGAFSFFPAATIPLGIVVGWKIGRIIRRIKKSKE